MRRESTWGTILGICYDVICTMNLKKKMSNAMELQKCSNVNKKKVMKNEVPLFFIYFLLCYFSIIETSELTVGTWAVQKS